MSSSKVLRKSKISEVNDNAVSRNVTVDSTVTDSVVADNAMVVDNADVVNHEQVAGGKRHFKCLMLTSDCASVTVTGRYSGNKPKQAASKACTRIYKTFEERNEEIPESIVFGMHECTRSSKRKKKILLSRKEKISW